MTSGLSTQEAKDSLLKYGPNQLPDKRGATSFTLLLNQFKNLLTLILAVAALISFVIGDRVDAFLILIILLLNTGLGFWQEYKASRELEALRKLEVSTSRVIRDGMEMEIASFELVPGDLVVLESGDKIPADGTLIESYSLSVNESSLTGESLPIIKSTKADENQVYFGTVVVAGRAKVQITQTGSNTRFGKIALTLSEVEEEPTPLEVSLNNLAKNVGIAAFVISILVFVIGLSHSQPVLEAFFSSVALMVAIVPEGLPAIITVLLAFGVRKMYHRKALVRKMSAIESLGATNIICTDKTGTLTKNQMKVKEVVYLNEKEKAQTLKASIICNSANLVAKEGQEAMDVLGDTTEGALLFWGKENKLDINEVRASGKILEEVPFDLKRRMMSVLWQEDGVSTLYSKGAPEVILPLCKLSSAELNKLNSDYKKMASKGLRVLAVAQKRETDRSFKEEGMTFLGLVGIADSPKEEASLAILKAEKAGIKVVMVTGDNELTAKAIAQEVGLLKPGDEVLLGSQIDELTDEELVKRIESVRIFARVIPEHKLRIVKVYQAMGKVVAVTGDGVNDSLALKQAHIGVAMGGMGTDVAKEASDVVILDDNLSTIISSIEEGRVIYSNISKVVRFLLAGNLSEVLLIVMSIIIGYPTPLLPVQLLWINFVTDGLPALSLAADPASKHVMSTPPRDSRQSLLSVVTIKYISLFGIIMAMCNLLVFIIFFRAVNLEVARSAVFTTTIVSQMIFLFILRKHHSIVSNKYLLYSVAFVLVVQALILFFEPLRSVFKLT